MQIAALLSFDVHLTGGHSLLEELISPALLALTAILAAFIAARTANERQAAQLAHDRELQAEQLTYDREQRNRQHVRDVVDEVVKGIDAATRLLTAYEAAIMVGDTTRTERREQLAGERKSTIISPTTVLDALKEETDKIHALSQATYNASIDLTSEGMRLAIRLGSGHQIVKSHQVFGDAYSERHGLLEPLYKRSLTDDDRDAIRVGSDTVGMALAACLNDCLKWFEEG